MTTTFKETLLTALNDANLNKLADVFAKIDLGTILNVTEYDTGTIPASATVALPGGALLVQSARVVTSGTAGSVGPYHVSDAGATPAVQPTATAYAGAAIGLASLSADGTTLTFPNTVTRVVVRYIKKPAVALSSPLAT